MANIPPAEQDAFAANFNYVFDASLQDGNRWINNPPAAQWDNQQPPMELWQQEGRVVIPRGQTRTAESHRTTYSVRPVWDPDNVRTEVLQRRGYYETLPAMPREERTKLTPLAGAFVFALHAPDGQSLLTVNDRVVDYLNTDHVPTPTTAAERYVGVVIGKSLLLGQSGEELYSGNRNEPSLPRSLNRATLGHHRKMINRYVSLHLETVLKKRTDSALHVEPLIQAFDVDKADTIKAVAALEAEGFVDASFWWRNGVQNELIFDSKLGDTVLSRVEESLATHDLAFFSETDHQQLTVRKYVSGVLRTYRADPNRKSEVLEQILTRIGTERSKKMGGGVEDILVDLRGIIAIANHASAGINEHLAEVGATQYQLPALDINRLGNVPRALLRILYATVRPNTNRADMEVMFERDTRIIAILEGIVDGMNYVPDTPNPADLLLRYPDLEATEIDTLMGPERNPSAGHRLDSRVRTKHKTRGTPGYGLFTPGRGKLS
jgi:hypothetical protein